MAAVPPPKEEPTDTGPRIPEPAPGPVRTCAETAQVPLRPHDSLPFRHPALLDAPRSLGVTVNPEARRRQDSGGADGLPRLLGRQDTPPRLRLDRSLTGWQNFEEAWVTPRVAHCDAPAGTPDRQEHRGSFRILKNPFSRGRGPIGSPAPLRHGRDSKAHSGSFRSLGTVRCGVQPREPL